VAKPEDRWPLLATDGIRFLATVEPASQHLLVVREVAPTGFEPVYPDDATTVADGFGLLSPRVSDTPGAVVKALLMRGKKRIRIKHDGVSGPDELIYLAVGLLLPQVVDLLLVLVAKELPTDGTTGYRLAHASTLHEVGPFTLPGSEYGLPWLSTRKGR
jgi:hypothetical protein